MGAYYCFIHSRSWGIAVIAVVCVLLGSVVAVSVAVYNRRSEVVRTAQMKEDLRAKEISQYKRF